MMNESNVDDTATQDIDDGSSSSKDQEPNDRMSPSKEEAEEDLTTAKKKKKKKKKKTTTSVANLKNNEYDCNDYDQEKTTTTMTKAKKTKLMVMVDHQQASTLFARGGTSTSSSHRRADHHPGLRFDPEGDIQPLPPNQWNGNGISIQSNNDLIFNNALIRGCPGAHAIGGAPPSYTTTRTTVTTDGTRSRSLSGAAETETGTGTETTPLEGFLCTDSDNESGEFRTMPSPLARQDTGLTTNCNTSAGFTVMTVTDNDNDIEQAHTALTVVAVKSSHNNKGSSKEDSQVLAEVEQAQYKKSQQLLLLLGGVCLVIVAAVVAVAVTILTSTKTSVSTNLESPDLDSSQPLLGLSSSSSSSSSNDSDYYPPFQDDLPAATLKALEEGPNTPESEANAWMWNDPYLSTYSPERQKQRFGLVATYYATQGDQWLDNSNWLDYEISECHWATKATADHPVCNDNNTFTTLDLHSNNLNGALPASFWLTKPTYLDLSHNSLEGQFPTFPTEHSDLLEALMVSNNSFTGQMRGGAGSSFGRLRIVRTDSNFLQGNNGAIYKLTPNLEILNFTSNLHSGGIHPGLKYLTKLRYLGASKNLLTGTMPTELGLLSSIQVIDYSDNQGLSGTIPSTLELLPKLVQLDIRGTGFTGSFPQLLCDRTKLEEDFLTIAANCSSMSCCSS